MGGGRKYTEGDRKGKGNGADSPCPQFGWVTVNPDKRKEEGDSKKRRRTTHPNFLNSAKPKCGETLQRAPS